MDDLYEVLGIKRTANEEEIRRAFRKKAKESHPDVGGDPNLFKEIKNAYDILSDPVSKMNYDELIVRIDEDLQNKESNHTNENAEHHQRNDAHEYEFERKTDHSHRKEETILTESILDESHKQYKKRMYIITGIVFILGIVGSTLYTDEKPFVTICIVVTLFGLVCILGSLSNLLAYYLQKNSILDKRNALFLLRWAASFFVTGVMAMTIIEFL